MTKAQAQNEFCTKKKLPRFAPADGKCWACNGDLYENVTMDEASSEIITGCSVCNHSFVS